MTEEWRHIRGFEGLYEVSDHGRIRSLVSFKRYKPGRILKPSLRDTGYLHVTLYSGDRTHVQRKIHRLVAEAFLGPCPSGIDVNHIDHNRQNNSAVNLEYLTRKQNLIHCAKARRFPRTQLSESEVAEIRKRYAQGGIFKRQLAVQYGMSTSGIASVLKGQSWAWTPDCPEIIPQRYKPRATG